MIANPDVDVVFGDSLMGNDDDGFVSFVRTYGGDAFFALPGASRPDGLRVLEREIFFRQLSTRNVMFLGSMLIRRTFFNRISGFDPALCGAADWDFFMRATAAGVVGYSDGSPVSKYCRQRRRGCRPTAITWRRTSSRPSTPCAVGRRAPPDLLAHVNERLRAHVFGWAWLTWEKGDFRVARRRLRLACPPLDSSGLARPRIWPAPTCPRALCPHSGVRVARSRRIADAACYPGRRVAIVVLNFNGLADTLTCLASLRRLRRPGRVRDSGRQRIGK